MPNDEYQLGALLGRGGMGQVHVARHRSGRVVAVKRVRNTLAGDRLVVDRLADEARMLRSVSHPNVVRALDDGTGNDGMPFLVMDRAYGTPLNQLIADHGALPRERLVAIASQLLAGLAAIHDAQVVHADLKSHNVLVDEVDIVTIIDFGLARTMNPSATENDLVAGTPAYMAPEMIAGAAPTVTADIYAAATIIYEMLTGSTPFSGHISTILTRQLAETVEPPSLRAPGRGISPAIDRVVLRALEPSPAARYPTVPEFAHAFSAALADEIAHLPMLARGSALMFRPQAQRLGTEPEPAPTVQHTIPDLPRALGRKAKPIARHRHESVISDALDQAQQLIRHQRIKLAVHKLEATLSSLAPPIDSEQPICASAWRLETVLAALYESLGKVDHARRMALVAYRHALRTGCPLAENRARAMVERLVVRPRRMARGTAPR
jgi:serine/threonine-protein kinase